jgi:adenine-specific DNA-methyltransferase
MTDKGDWVLDPFMGVGSTAIASLIHNRKAIGAEIMPEYIEVARDRIERAEKGDLKIRPMMRPVYDPAEPKKNLPPKNVKINTSQASQQKLLEEKARYGRDKK